MNNINWRKREEHPGTCDDGPMLVAVEMPDEELAIDVVELVKSDDRFEIWHGGQVRMYEWSDVAYWVPMEEVEATLPKPTEEVP